MNKNHQTIGYLPDETPSLPKLLLYALQQVIVMFPATVAGHYHRFSSQQQSLPADLRPCVSSYYRKKDPLYYGSSFLMLQLL